MESIIIVGNGQVGKAICDVWQREEVIKVF